MEPGIVRAAIDRAKAYWAGTGDIAGTVATLIAPISTYQPFRDTNHRTAHAMAHALLKESGYAALAPEQDDELAEVLAKDREPWRTESQQIEAITELFHKRLAESRG